MSVDGEKKTFVMKHTFTDVRQMKDGSLHFGPVETHFGVTWRFMIYKHETFFDVWFQRFEGPEGDWLIDTTINTKIETKIGEATFVNEREFTKSNKQKEMLKMGGSLDICLVDGNLTFECHVTINKMTGFEIPILRSFDDDSAKDLSDIVLKVKDQKFHVYKMYLAVHSTFFKVLFLGNFEESKQSEVELKGIEPEDFQKFLEVLYGEPAIDEDNIEGILHIADMYDARTVIRQCEHFYLCLSQQDLKSKFNAAVKYNMKKLQQKCMSEIKSGEDIEKIIPEDGTHLDQELWRQLLNKSVDFYKKK